MRERYRKAGSRLHIIAAGTTGCGSFLENFASSLHIPVDKIADAAFSSRHPAVLGSRCTVFMNSSIITEQRNGRRAEDIMAGLCRSIIENVFTKVVRLSNVDSLGDRIVVQGGTFENDAVLRALEEYIGKGGYAREVGRYASSGCGHPVLPLGMQTILRRQSSAQGKAE